MELFANFIVSLADAFLLFCLVKSFLPQKPVSRGNIFSILILLGTLNALIAHQFDIANLLSTLLMILLAGLLFYKFLFYSGAAPIYGLLFIGLILLTVAELLTASLLLAVTRVPPSAFTSWSFYRAISVTLSKSAFALLLFRGVPRMNLSLDMILSKRSSMMPVLLVSTVNLALIYIVYNIFQYSGLLADSEKKYIIGITIAVMLFSTGLLLIIHKTATLLMKQVEWRVKEEAYQRQVFCMNSLHDALASVRAQRHDFNHHLNCLYGLLQMERHREAGQYIHDLISEVDAANHIVGIDHPEMAALLNVKRMISHEKKIPMTLEVALPSTLPLNALDLSIIMGNLLTNAIEACDQLPLEQRFIQVAMALKNDHLRIEVINGKDPGYLLTNEKLQQGFSTKGQEGERGLGLKSVQRIVKRYGGLFRFSDETDRFSVQIALPLKN